MAQILVVEDEEILARNICDSLAYDGHQTSSVRTGEECLECVRKLTPDLLLLDLRLPKIDGLDVLRLLKDQSVFVPVIVMTAHGTIDVAVEAMKLGAREFLTKPLDIKALQLMADRVLEHQRVIDNLDYFRTRERAESGVGMLIGQSAHIRYLREWVLKLARSPALATEYPPSILLTGETGTGKDLVARAIHYEGPRSQRPFVPVNCTAIPDELFEAELFGHVKGAFTSAQASKKGLLEVANGGTIFFDEIGHMKQALQAKLLSAIEHKKIRPVGGTAERRVDVHVISATNRDLENAIEAGEFRDDLYHRLRVVPIALAPLRERPEDVQPLAAFFLARYAARASLPVRGINSEALSVLQAYDWPGNVRELSHVLENAVLMCDEQLIGPEHLQIRVRDRQPPVHLALPGAAPIVIDFDRGGPVLEDIEHAVLEAALVAAGHNISRAARLLGVTREAVRYRLEKHRARVSQSPGGR